MRPERLVAFVLLVGLLLVEAHGGTLKALFVFFRHGNRAPYLFYQNDSHGNLDAWPNGIAQLTAKGEEQAAKIGEYLRETYRTDLSIDEANQIEIVTTEVMRVRKTAESAFKAFVATTELEKSSQFMPLRMGVIPHYSRCPANAAEAARLEKQQPFVEIIRRNEEIFRNLSSEHNITFGDEFKGAVGSEADALHKIVDTFQLEFNEGFGLPDWLTPELHTKLKQLDAEYFNFLCSSKRFVRINAGPLFYDLSDKIRKLTETENKSPGYDFTKVNVGASGNKKLNLYAATDIVMNNLLVGLSVVDPLHHLVPPPASTIIIELHRTANRTVESWDESSSVKVFYFNETVHPITAKGYFLRSCTVRSFLSSISDLALSQGEWLKACYGLDAETDSCSDRTILLVITIVLAVLVALLLIALCILGRNLNKRKVNFTFRHELTTT